MVEPGVDEGLGGAVWPAVPVKHHYAVSEALPLHRLGLVPPPPEIGPHLLTASPLEAALAAAEATAELQAIAPPAPEPEAEPEPALSADAEPPPSTVAITEAPWSQAPLVTDPDRLDAVATDGPLAIAPPDMDIQRDAPRDDVRAGEPSPNDAPAWTLAAEEIPDDPMQIAPPEMVTLTGPVAADVDGPANGKLMKLDLSRRGDAPPGIEMPLPPPPESTFEPPAVATSTAPPPLPLQPAMRAASTVVKSGAAPSNGSQPASEARSRMSMIEPPAGNWPGFLTGIVMAVAIGVGLYVSLVGS